MNTVSMYLLQGAAGGGSNMLLQLAPFALVILIFYFLIIRPQSKKQKQTEKMLDSLKKGDKVVTIGGIHGVVQSVKDGTVVVKVDEACKLEFSRSAVATVVTEGTPAEKTPAKAKKDKKAEAEAPAQIEEEKK